MTGPRRAPGRPHLAGDEGAALIYQSFRIHQGLTLPTIYRHTIFYQVACPPGGAGREPPAANPPPPGFSVDCSGVSDLDTAIRSAIRRRLS